MNYSLLTRVWDCSGEGDCWSTCKEVCKGLHLPLSRGSETFPVDNLARVEQNYKMDMICNGN